MVKRLGTGGMGDVWSARDEMLGEHVALKFIRPGVGAHDSDWIERLLAEAGLARRITHPNVCRVHDASEVEGEFFISMELVPGGDLARRLRRHDPPVLGYVRDDRLHLDLRTVTAAEGRILERALRWSSATP